VTQSFCTICRRRIPKGSRCTEHAIRSPSNRAWHEPGAARRRKQVIDRDKGCRLCGKTEDLQVHHIVGAAQGGTNAFSNLIVLCGACHHKVERDELAIPGHMGRTEASQGLRSALRGSSRSTDIEKEQKWAS
jgi:5-methylcytosine-specific restriction endonuclease McrA